MAETLPGQARAWAFLEIESDAERQAIPNPSQVTVQWVVRGGPARPSDLLLRSLQAFTPPPGAGHAYVIGETSGVRAQRHWLLEQGWPRERITAEGYWRPGRIGGHDHV
jgi:NADPH-dependent ferric siderophore reductase